MRRFLAAALALLIGLSPVESFAASRQADVRPVPGVRLPVSAPNVSLPLPAVSLKTPGLAVPALPAVAPTLRIQPDKPWPRAEAAQPQQDEQRQSEEKQAAGAAAKFDGAVPSKGTVSDGLSAEAVKELLRMRRDVQQDAREVLREEMAGDVGDGRLHRDVNRVLGRLVRAAGLPKEAAQAFIGNSFLPNAFTTVTESEAEFIEKKASIAKPFRVSNVFVSLGLLRALDSEEELAFVLAHELNHNWKEHLKGFAGSHEMLGHFHEFEADFEAVKLIAKAGYDPRKALDTLYALDRAYEKLEKEYALFSRKDKGEIAQAMERVRDVHPHADLRRANMLDHLDEALELYKPQPVPAKPKWMELRASAQRPSALDRFEKRARGAAAQGTIDERLHKLEAFAEREKAKRTLSVDEKAVIEEAYRDVIKTKPDFEGTRSIQLSIERGEIGKRLNGQLISRQLELVLDEKDPTLEDFLRASAGLGDDALRAGALRLMGTVKDRRHLDAMYSGLTHGAESLGLTANGKTASYVARRLWRSTRRVLTAELGRPAKPEEIVDELKAKLSPSWLRKYWNVLQTEIAGSAMERPEWRSEKYTPSQLAMRLRSLDDSRDEKSRTSLKGFTEWAGEHYTEPKIEPKGERMVVQYERYHVEGHASPSERDFLDLMKSFEGGWTIPPAVVRMLRRDGLLEKYLDLAVAAQEDLIKKEKGRKAVINAHLYKSNLSNILRSALHGVSDLEETARISELVWKRARQTHALLKTEGREEGLKSDELAAALLSQIAVSARVAVLRLNTAGQRPRVESLKALTELTRDIETTLGLASGRDVVAAHARAVVRGAATSQREYMQAFADALPQSVYSMSRLRRWFRRGRPEAARSLRSSDMLSLLLLAVDDSLPAAERAGAAALADRFHTTHDREYGRDVEEVVSMTAGHTIGRWLLESAVAKAKGDGTLSTLIPLLLTINDYQPALLNPMEHTDKGSAREAFRSRTAYTRRNEPLRTLARQEHPFRNVNTRWGLELMAALDAAKAWPQTLAERLDLLDMMNSSGEFSDALDERIIAEAASDTAAFREWVKSDEKRLKRLGGSSEDEMETPMGPIMVPRAAPLRIVRNPNLRVKLFDLMPQSDLKEKAPRRTLRQTVSGWVRLYHAYRFARKFFSREFLWGLRQEGSLESKFYLVIEEVDRVARKKAEEYRERWDKGDFDRIERDAEWKGRKLPRAWKEALPHEKDEILKGYRMAYQQAALSAVYNLYLAYAAQQEPVLGFILDNYPEPTRARDELLERVMKARRLTPGALSFLEANKSYRQPNPVRVAEKQFLDQAITHLRRFAPADRVDLILHTAGLVTLSKERQRALDHKFLKGDRKKLARDKAALKGVTQLKGYLTLLHPRDRSMLVRGLFFGPDSLHKNPAEVQRLYESIVITGRGLPKFVEETFRAYFRVLTDDEKAVLISSLAGTADMGQNLTGPEVVRIALKGMGVTGAKVAQVLATHRGLLPDEYAAALEGFKDRAQDMGKMRAYDLMKERLEELAEDPGKPREVALSDVSALADAAIPEENPALRRRLARQVKYVLAEEGKQVRRVDYIGPELGSGSIKVVYKVELADGRLWVVKLRAPGALHRTKREFEIVEAMVADLEKSGTLDLPGVRQLIEEVRGLVRAEMDFRDEAAKETGVRDRANARPWYARLLIGRAPYVPKPHSVYKGEDLLVEEFVPVRRFFDLPNWSLLGPSKRSIARKAVDEGTYALVHDEWLEPDAHTGNRYARRGWLDLLMTRLVIIDLGQGQPSPAARLKPLMLAGIALDSGDAPAAAARLMDTLDATGAASPAAVQAAVAKGLAARPKAGIVERLMDGYLEAEKSGALVKPEYAALQKGFLIYGGYAEWLPANGLYASLERAGLARMLRDGTATKRQLLKLGIKRLVFGRAAVRAEMEALISRM